MAKVVNSMSSFTVHTMEIASLEIGMERQELINQVQNLVRKWATYCKHHSITDKVKISNNCGVTVSSRCSYAVCIANVVQLLKYAQLVFEPLHKTLPKQ